MKKIFLMLFAVATLSLVGCASEGSDQSASGAASEASASQSGSVDAFPWDFPMDIALDAEVGQTVLAPYTYYPIAIRDGEDLLDKGLIFYNTTMEEVGKTSSALGSKKDQIPNALIIPLAKDQQAKVGDVVLTWWQGGSGMQRALVVDASNPAQPKVNFLDLSWDRSSDDRPSMGEDHAEKELKASSFQVLKNEAWEPGAQVAVRENGKWSAGTLIREKDGKILVLGFAAKVKAFKKDDAKIIPFKEDIKPGDAVHCYFVGSYNDGYTVTKVDEKRGLITCKDSHDKEKVYPITQVTKVL